MTKLTNRADAARGFNVPTGAGGSRQVMLQPGESIEIADLSEAAHHTLAGWVASGDLVLDEDDAGAAAVKMTAEADALAKKQVAAANAEKAAAEQRAAAAAAISKDADTAAEQAEADVRADRAGDPRPQRPGKVAAKVATPAAPAKPAA